MRLLLAVLLVLVVHLTIGITAWCDVGFLADDREMVGAAILRHGGAWTLSSAFLMDGAADAMRALYRPFVELLFWLEYPCFGVDAFGYHCVNSVMHCGSALLWYSMLRRWSGSHFAALAAALLFVGWPSHSEATHWIAARVNVMSVFVMSIALWLHDRGVREGRARWPLLLLAGGFGAVAVGCKESAVFVVPLAVVVAWLHAPSLRAAALRSLPMVATVFAWLAWRAHQLGTWGSGSNYGWKLTRISAQTCSEWVTVLLAPFHSGLRHPLESFGGVALALVHIALLVPAAMALRTRGGRRAAAVGGTLVAMGYLAGIGLEHMSASTLLSARYTYEPALGLAVLFGLGIARLPVRAAIPVLAVVVLVHALALAHNRQSWLRASAVYECMRAEVEEKARATQQPLCILDAPGVYDGALACLNGFTEFLFWQQTAPSGTNLRGRLASTQEWRRTMANLAEAAASKRPLSASLVRWSDGTLRDLVLDPQWPAQPFPGVTVGYARIARIGIVEDTSVPIQVLVTTSRPLTIRVGAQAVDVAPSEAPQPLQLWLPVRAGTSHFAAELVVEHDAQQRRFDLGQRSVMPR